MYFISIQIKPNTITVILKKARDGDWAGISATEAKEKKAREEKTRYDLKQAQKWLETTLEHNKNHAS